MSENPRGTFAASPFQWLALVVPGLTVGLALRLGTQGAATPTGSFPETSAAHGSSATVASGPGDPTSRRPRPAARTSTPKDPPLTAEQAEALLSDPSRHRISLDQILAGQATSSERAGWLAGFFGWDESQALAIETALADFKRNVRALIDERTVIETSQAGVIEFDYSAVADDYQKEVDLLLAAIGDALGDSAFRQFERLGILRDVEDSITPETRLTLRLVPRLGSTIFRGEHGYVLNLSLKDHGRDVPDRGAGLHFNPERNGPIPPIDFLKRLPPVDWVHEVERASNAPGTDPQ